MPYNSLISSTDVAGIIPTQYSYELINSVAETSLTLQLARRLRDMTEREQTMPVMSALATAYFLTGDTDLVQTSEVNWEDVTLTIADLAVLVPIPKTVLDDARIPIWSQVQPELVTACGVAIDNAILLGTNKPTAWPTAIVTNAAAKSNSASEAAFADLYDAILGDGGVFSLVEQDGFGVTGGIARLNMKGKLRGCRDANGMPIFNRDPAVDGGYMLDGVPTLFPKTGIGSASYPLIAGEWNQLVYSMRADMNFGVYDQGVIQDAGGNIVYNLMQQRMAALMVVMRLGFALPNPITRANQSASTRYPFAILTA